jgi:hypothetical protein
LSDLKYAHRFMQYFDHLRFLLLYVSVWPC